MGIRVKLVDDQVFGIVPSFYDTGDTGVSKTWVCEIDERSPGERKQGAKFLYFHLEFLIFRRGRVR